MRKVSRDLVIKPARKIRPDVKLIIKYPNWHEHFQAAGFDLEQQPDMFDCSNNITAIPIIAISKILRRAEMAVVGLILIACNMRIVMPSNYG